MRNDVNFTEILYRIFLQSNVYECDVVVNLFVVYTVVGKNEF